MKLLLTDSTSPLGAAILESLEREAHSLLQPSTDELDWRDASAVLDYLREQRPDIVINTFSADDSADAASWRLGVDVAGHLAQACKDTGTVPIHLSSYRVFDGASHSSFSENDTPASLSDFGRAQVEAERHFQNALPHWICLRFSWLIDAGAGNQLADLLARLSAPGKVSVSAQRQGAPTPITDAARVLVAVVQQVLSGADNWGFYHYCATPVCSEADFARQVADILVQEGELKGELLVQEACAAAVEPASAVLTCERLWENFGVQSRSWRQGLNATVKFWLRENHTVREPS